MFYNNQNVWPVTNNKFEFDTCTMFFGCHYSMNNLKQVSCHFHEMYLFVEHGACFKRVKKKINFQLLLLHELENTVLFDQNSKVLLNRKKVI